MINCQNDQNDKMSKCQMINCQNDQNAKMITMTAVRFKLHI